MIANKLILTEIKPQTLSNQIDFDSEDVTNKKNKRKSRWAKDNVKVSSTISGTPSIAIGQINYFFFLISRCAWYVWTHDQSSWTK